MIKTDVEPTKVAKYHKAPFYDGETVIVLKPLKWQDYVEDNPKEKEWIEKINILIKNKELVGKVFKTESDYITIDFKKQYFFTVSVYPIDLIYPDKKTFFIFPSDNLGGLTTANLLPSDEIAFMNFMNNQSRSTLEQDCKLVSSFKNNVETYERSIKDYLRNINEYKKSIIKDSLQYNDTLQKIKDKLEEENPIANDYLAYYRSIFKNKNVASIDVVQRNNESCLLIETNDLEYCDSKKHDYYGHIVQGLKFNIGKYIILIEPNGGIHASNMTKFIGSHGSNHVCVSSSSEFCTGAAFGEAIKQVIKKKDYANAIHMIIDFLKDPNSGNPYSDSVLWYFAQDKVYKPKNKMDYLFKSAKDNEKWDSVKASQQHEKFIKTLK